MIPAASTPPNTGPPAREGKAYICFIMTPFSDFDLQWDRYFVRPGAYIENNMRFVFLSTFFTDNPLAGLVNSRSHLKIIVPP